MPTLSERQREALDRQLAAGGEASAALERITKTCPSCGTGTTILTQRTQQLIKEACDWFRQPGSSKDDHIAVRYIAALAEIRDLEYALSYRVRQAEKAKVTLYGGDQTAEA